LGHSDNTPIINSVTQVMQARMFKIEQSPKLATDIFFEL